MKFMRHLSAEAIGFQNDTLGSGIEQILHKLKELIDANPSIKHDELNNSGLPGVLDGYILDRLGLNVSVDIGTNTAGCIIVFPMNRNHVLLKDMWRDNYFEKSQSDLTKNLNGKKGTVDTNAARVSGIFSEYKHRLYIDLIGLIKGDFGKPLNVPEITAIILHELGHAFTYYELSDRLNSTNQILADISLTLKKEKSREKRTYLFKELSEKLGKDSKDLDELLEEGNSTVFGVKLFKFYFDGVRTLMHNSKYDETSAEQLADQFAARFGYGRQLIMALEKLTTRYMSHRTGFYWDLFFDTLATAGRIISIFTAGSIPLGILIAALYTLFIFGSGDAVADMTYDKLKTRYTRIRNQTIAALSADIYTKDEIKIAVENIEQMDKIIKGVFEHELWFTRIANFVFAYHRTVKEDIAYQQLMEELVHNDLFLKSAQLRVASNQ